MGTFSFSEVIHIGTRTLIWRQTCWPLNRLLHKIVQIKLGDDLFKTTDRCGQSSKVSTIYEVNVINYNHTTLYNFCHCFQKQTICHRLYDPIKVIFDHIMLTFFRYICDMLSSKLQAFVVLIESNPLPKEVCKE